MPTIKNTKGTIHVCEKLILVGTSEEEIKLENLSRVQAKFSMCVLFMAKYYEKNTNKYGEPLEFIRFLSSNFTHIDLATNKGRELGTQINTRFLNKLKKIIEAYILMDLYKKGKLKID
ncbi:TPA: hypothetical protein JI046_02390 [Acinetobacter baumannii]|nr:hypothetical protein [Acinetobacter baumannii]